MRRRRRDKHGLPDSKLVVDIFTNIDCSNVAGAADGVGSFPCALLENVHGSDHQSSSGGSRAGRRDILCGLLLPAVRHTTSHFASFLLARPLVYAGATGGISPTLFCNFLTRIKKSPTSCIVPVNEKQNDYKKATGGLARGYEIEFSSEEE